MAPSLELGAITGVQSAGRHCHALAERGEQAVGHR